ncbi:hypothetical protein P43SY_007757 [Pythium insidiosum]|uniref:F-box/LRR-repeat protein 15-like leucin rich repeat domain-containing protein n=1 Tax=Pythium insidiosum TaxID=114742 RepID=A0AAD5LX31_PYTIN|nr:hypothetical protein P43SY_007757 [Pythium insidiosum]
MPSQFLHVPHVAVSRWTVIVSDITLHRIAARNRRIHQLRQRAALVKGGLESLPSSLSSSSLLGPFSAVAADVEPTRSLVLNGAERITDMGLCAVAENVPTLEVLEIAHAGRISDAALRVVALRCPSLTKLNLSGCTGIRGAGLGAITEYCTHVQDLALADCPQLPEWVLLRCCFAFTGLRTLNLARCPQISDHVLKTVANQCRDLRVLNLTDCYGVSDVGVVAIAQKCRQLESVVLSRSKLSEKLTDSSCIALGEHCSSLSDVQLAGCHFITDAGIKWLAEGCTTSLRALDLAQLFHNVSDVGLRFLATGCPQLQVLQLQRLYLVSDGSNRDFGLEGLQAVANGCSAAIAVHGTALRELVVSQCDRITDVGLRHLAQRADQFELLDFSGCVKLTDVGLNALVDAFQRPSLAHLYLTGCPNITQDIVARLAMTCPLLLTLSVYGCRVSARVLQSLRSSWPFGELRVPLGTGTHQELGIFPAHRAKDRRFVEESCVEWVAAIRIQALLRRLIQSGLDKAATKIQRQYRAKRQQRRADVQRQAVFERQLERVVVFVQRRFRAMRASRLAKTMVAALRRQRERENRAATIVQRRFRGNATRRRVDLLRVQRQLRASEEQKASLRIQTLYRGRADRKKARELEEQRRRLEVQRQHMAIRIQSQVRRRLARREADRRRKFQLFQEQCATKLQTAFRARRSRQAVDLLRLAQHHAEMNRAAIFIQTQWRGRRHRLAFQIHQAVRRRQLERQSEAATLLQRTFRRYASICKRRMRNVQ